jgi:predicted RNA-binding protein
MASGPTHYIVVTSPENWAKTAERGWTVLGLKSTKPGQAAGFKPGDKVIAYATGIKRFIGAVEVTSELFVDHTPIWGSPKKPGEDYPNRLHTRPLVTLDEAEYVDAFELARRLEYARKWGDHISLAFQGNIRAIPKADFDLILDEMEHAKRAVGASPA